MHLLNLHLSAVSRSILCGIALFAASMPAALALPIVMQSSTTGLFFEDDGVTGSGIDGSFGIGQMNDVSGTGSIRALAQPFDFSSVFEISNISSSSSIESAIVTGEVDFVISSSDTAGGRGFLLSDLSFSSITLEDGIGLIAGNLINITNFSSTTFLYNEYNTLAAAGKAVFNISFNYDQTKSLTDLITDEVSGLNFTAEITTASIPAIVPLWLFGAALAGLAVIRYQNLRKVRSKA